MRACAPLAATLALFAAAAGCASPTTPDQTGNAGGTGNTTGVAGTGGTSTVVMCGPQTPPAPSGGAAYPFPQHRLSQNCSYPTNCTDADVQAAWDTYKSRHIVARQPRAARAAPVGQQRHRVRGHGVRDVVRRLHERQGDV